tara:strand:+ start:1853 stop:2419 length:567 start_codon:yes stop_codon:yes gene_type:complete
MAPKIYTRTGDTGDTGLFGGGRVSKGDLRVEAYGTVDELNAALGWAASKVNEQEIKGHIETVQDDLFVIGADLATSPPTERRAQPKVPILDKSRIGEMESWIDAADDELPGLTAFVLPGGSEGAAALHMARTICRRAERAVVRLGTQEDVIDDVIPYLNRLSDLLFTLARLENHRAGISDREWSSPDG